MIRYEFHTKLKGNNNLVIILNNALKASLTARIIFAPKTFKNIVKENPDVFYQLCLFEIYANSLIERLNEWQKELLFYFNDFEGSWEYYAASNRLGGIIEYGGDENDYNDDGTVKTEVGKEKLIQYSIIENLIPGGVVDIVNDTTVTDLSVIFNCILVDSSMSIGKILEDIFSKPIPIYKEDEDGNMVEMKWAEKELNRIDKENEATQLISCLMLIVGAVQGIIGRLKKLKKDRDNKKALSDIRADITNLLDFNVMKLKKYYKAPF